jgi:hypothetical protein
VLLFILLAVSEMPSHADISITLHIYTHMNPHMQQAAVAVMDTRFYHRPQPVHSAASGFFMSVVALQWKE